MMDDRIRPYGADDFAAVTRLWRRARLESLPEFSARHAHTCEEDCLYFREHILARNQLWVLDVDGCPAAFLAVKDEFIDCLYVDPSHWRQGLGKALLAHARSLSPRRLWLYTLEENVNARAFYEKNGFRAVKFGISPPPESELHVQYEWALQDFPDRPISSR